MRTDVDRDAPRRGDVAIYTGPAWAPWSPTDVEERGLGGSETAVVRLAESFSRSGYAVSVFGDIEDTTVYRDIAFRHWESFEPLEPRLATISGRVPRLFDRALASCHRTLWAHDLDYGTDITTQRAASMDMVIVASRWHQRHIEARYPFLIGKVRAVSNGVDHSYFADPAPDLTTRASRVLYTSAPDRGLDVLLELWPFVRRQVPEAELAFCYPTAYDIRASRNPALADLYRQVAALAEQAGVVRLGSLGQAELAQLMTMSRVWVAPSWCSPCQAPFLETYCIGAVEAQAAGCWVVASAVGALTETVQVGHLLKSKPNSDRWRQALVDAIVAGLSDPSVHRRASDGPPAVSHLGWQDVGRQFVALVEAGLDTYPPDPALVAQS